MIGGGGFSRCRPICTVSCLSGFGALLLVSPVFGFGSGISMLAVRAMASIDDHDTGQSAAKGGEHDSLFQGIGPCHGHTRSSSHLHHLLLCLPGNPALPSPARCPRAICLHLSEGRCCLGGRVRADSALPASPLCPSRKLMNRRYPSSMGRVATIVHDWAAFLKTCWM